MPTAEFRLFIVSGKLIENGGVAAPVAVPTISKVTILLSTHLAPVKVISAEPVVVTVNDDHVPIMFISDAVSVWPTVKLPRVVMIFTLPAESALIEDSKGVGVKCEEVGVCQRAGEDLNVGA